jgi:hypothetical protein
VSVVLLFNFDRDFVYGIIHSQFRAPRRAAGSIDRKRPKRSLRSFCIAVSTRSGITRREKSTLWLMLPEIGSLRFGFVSKAQDKDSDVSMDDIIYS